jgi:hypothetical protein
MKRLLTASIALLGLFSAGCSEMQQIPMNQAQTDSYNQCMSTHWSTLADSALFGIAGYEYHQNQVLNCQQVALTKVTAPATSAAASDSAVKPTVATSATTTGPGAAPAPASR